MSILDRIVGRVSDRLTDRKRERSPADMRREAEERSNPASFRAALDRSGTSLIAEAKAASPSRGTLRDPYDPAALARAYEAAGARALSVLTEPDFFRGAPEHLRVAVASCDVPVLRKDFLIDPYQVWEAKIWGASAALLIVAALPDERLRDLHDLLVESGLEALVEVHTEAEAERALAVGATIVGVNNRDLATFETDLQVTARVAAGVPDDVLLVSESGITTRDDGFEVVRAGARAILVGGALVTAEDPGAMVEELVA